MYKITLTFEEAPRHAACAICSIPTINRYRLDPETLMIACSLNHAHKLVERIFGQPAPPSAIPAAPLRVRSQNGLSKIKAPQSQNKRLRRAVIPAGERHNRLRYVGPADAINGILCDLWLCDCGATTSKRRNNVISGQTKSCSRSCPFNLKSAKADPEEATL